MQQDAISRVKLFLLSQDKTEKTLNSMFKIIIAISLTVDTQDIRGENYCRFNLAQCLHYINKDGG